MPEDPKRDESLTEAEKMQRTAEVVKRMLATPPKPAKRRLPGGGEQAPKPR